MTALANLSDYQSPYCPHDNTALAVDEHGIHALLIERNETRDTMVALHKMAHGQTRALRAFGKTKYLGSRTEFNGMLGSVAENLFNDLDTAICHLDAEYWARAVKLAAVTDVMSSQRKKEWQTAIEALDVPPFEQEHVLPTLEDLLGLRSSHFAERVDALFHALSPEHVTNSPAAFGKRMIIKGNVFGGGHSQEQIDALDDLRVVVAILLRRAPLRTSQARTGALLDSLAFDDLLGQWVAIDQGAIRIKAFKVGTLHIEVHPDVVFKLNDILAMRYPLSIPARFRRAPSKPSKAFPEPVRDALPFSVIKELSDVRRIQVRSSLEHRRLYPDHEAIFDVPGAALSDEAGAVLEALGASRIDPVAWQCEFNLIPVLREIARTGGLPNKQSHQYYPSKGDVGEQAAAILNSHVDDDAELLEPSAGRAHLARHIRHHKLTLVEFSSINCAILSAMGYNTVHNGDFLAYAKTHRAEFDGVLMNPPFADGQAKAHVLAALSTLRANGVCVAIVPANLSTDDFSNAYREATQTDVIEGAFEDANVSVRILTLRV